MLGSPFRMRAERRNAAAVDDIGGSRPEETLYLAERSLIRMEHEASLPPARASRLMSLLRLYTRVLGLLGKEARLGRRLPGA